VTGTGKGRAGAGCCAEGTIAGGETVGGAAGICGMDGACGTGCGAGCTGTGLAAGGFAGRSGDMSNGALCANALADNMA